MVWYSHVLKNFPHFVVIHTVKVFSVVNEADIDVFLELSWFFDDPANVGNLKYSFRMRVWVPSSKVVYL